MKNVVYGAIAVAAICLGIGALGVARPRTVSARAFG